MNRRRFIQYSVAGTAALASFPAFSTEKKKSFPIGACDWSIGKRGSVEAMSVARTIGLSGVQVSFGKPGAEVDLRKAETRKAYVDAARKTGVGIASLAMGVLNHEPYSSSPDAEKWVSDCIDVMATMKKEAAEMKDRQLAAKVSPDIVLLAFFGKGDINGKPDLMKSVIERLKKVAPKAEKAGVVLGIESWLSREDHMKIIDGVGSSAVQVYYDVANSTKQGYDIYEEIKTLGTKYICQMHAKENGFLLGEGKVDFPRLKKVLDGIGYSDWLVIESAIPKKTPMEKAYKHNRAYLEKVFHGK